MASEQEVSESLSSDATFHVASKNSITFTFRLNDCDASSFPSVAREVFVQVPVLFKDCEVDGDDDVV